MKSTGKSWWLLQPWSSSCTLGIARHSCCQKKTWCLYIIASIAKPYLRAVTRQVLQNRCPHGVESTSFQEGSPLRGSRQIGHWRGSSDILKVSLFYVFEKSRLRNSLTVKYPGILRLPSEDSKIIANCITNLWRALSFLEYLHAKSRWMLTLIDLSQTRWINEVLQDHQ